MSQQYYFKNLKGGMEPLRDATKAQWLYRQDGTLVGKNPSYKATGTNTASSVVPTPTRVAPAPVAPSGLGGSNQMSFGTNQGTIMPTPDNFTKEVSSEIPSTTIGSGGMVDDIGDWFSSNFDKARTSLGKLSGKQLADVSKIGLDAGLGIMNYGANVDNFNRQMSSGMLNSDIGIQDKINTMGSKYADTVGGFKTDRQRELYQQAMENQGLLRREGDEYKPVDGFGLSQYKLLSPNTQGVLAANATAGSLGLTPIDNKIFGIDAKDFGGGLAVLGGLGSLGSLFLNNPVAGGR
jgi:hypothetical protein